MNKKVVAATIALLMTLSTILMAVPVNAIINPLPVFNNASGATCSQQTITAPDAGVLVTGLTSAREVFVLFDKEVADADLGARLYPLGAVAGPPAGTEMYARTAPVPPWPAGQYIPGDAIYVDLPAGGVGVVTVGDVRESPVTAPGGQVYAAGSTVAVGDTDIGTPLFGFPAYVMRTAVSAAAAALGFNWATDGIYIRDASNNVAGFNDRVGPGDIRAKYPSVTVTLAPGAGITYTYAAWTKVYSPSFDFQKPIYNHPGGAGIPQAVTAGDVRLRNVVVPQVRYTAGSAVLPGASDQAILGMTTTAFPIPPALNELMFADTNGNGQWDQGESIYLVPAAPYPATRPVDATMFRRTYVDGYAPLSRVLAGDLDIGTAIRLFQANQSFYDADTNGVYSYGEWIYNQAAGVFPVVAPFTTRASAVDFTDKGMAATGRLSTILPLPWGLVGTQWSNIVGYAAGTHVLAGEADVGRPLSAFAATDKHSVAGAYVSGDLIYRDNDGNNIISVGDTRQVIVGRGPALVPYPGPWPWTAANAPYYILGTNIAAGDADAIPTPLQTFCTGVGTPVAGCAGAEMYYDQFNDGAYLGSDLVAVGGVSNTGYAAPFPVDVRSISRGSNTIHCSKCTTRQPRGHDHDRRATIPNRNDATLPECRMEGICRYLQPAQPNSLSHCHGLSVPSPSVPP